MSFVGQRIRNRFPLWSKIRRDNSSTGAILFDAIGESIEEQHIALNRIKEQYRCLEGKPVYELGFFNIFNLSESAKNYFEYIQDNKDFKSISLVGKNQCVLDNGVWNCLEEINLEFVDNYFDLSKAYPSRISLKEVKESDFYLISELSTSDRDANSYELYKNPGRIYLRTYGSVDYSDLTFDRNVKESYYIIVRGRDISNRKVEEKVNVNGDGLYSTKTIFSKLESLTPDIDENIVGGASIERHGFDGIVEVLKYPFQIKNQKYDIRSLIKKNDDFNFNNSLEDNVLELNLLVENSRSYLEYIFKVYKEPNKYINSKNDLDKEQFEQVLYKKELLKENESQVLIQDYTIDYVRDKILTIDDLGVLYWYDVNRNHFTNTKIPRTRTAFITLESDKQDVVLNDSLDLHVSIERAKGVVEKVIIARQTPTNKALYNENSGFLLEYLQENKTWSEDIYAYSGKDFVDLFQNFDSISFSSEFVEHGQHDFYVMTFTNSLNEALDINAFLEGNIEELKFKKQVINTLKQKVQYDLFVDTYSVMCESAIYTHKVETQVLNLLTSLGKDSNEYSLGIYMDGPENTIYVLASNQSETIAYKVIEYKDYFIFNYDNGICGFTEDYERLEININNEFSEVITK